MSQYIHRNLPFEAIDAPKCPGYCFCNFGRSSLVESFEICERRLELCLEPGKHIIRHPPVLHPSSIFASADIAGVDDEQSMDRRQRPPPALEFQESPSFCKKTLLGVKALQ